METVTKLPEKKGVIGTREVSKAVMSGKIRHIIVARNCPGHLVEKVAHNNVTIEQFDGDQRQLGTKLGKPFAVALVGYE